MSVMRCGFCLCPGHDKQDCPTLLHAPVRDVEDTPPADAHDALVLRLFTLRAYARGLLADLHAAGRQPSPETLALTPPSDSLEP
jgi:hypothetical protein